MKNEIDVGFKTFKTFTLVKEFLTESVRKGVRTLYKYVWLLIIAVVYNYRF